MLSIYKPAEKFSYWSTKKANKPMFKATILIEKGGFRLPQPGALITSTDNSWPPPLPFHTALKIHQRTYTRFINMPHPYKHSHSHRQKHTHTGSFTHTHTHTHTLTHWLTRTRTHTRTHAHTHTHTGKCVKSVNMFGWGIFGAVWKGRGGGQELSVGVIRAPGWGSWYPPFRSVFLL